MADLTLAVAQSHAEAPHQTGHSKKSVQPIAQNFTEVLKYDPNQPRDDQGQWSKTSGRSFSSEEGYEWHEQGPGAKWAKAMPVADQKALDNYSGFGYSQINELRRGIQPTRTVKIRVLTPEEHKTITAMTGMDSGNEIRKLVPPEGPEFHYEWAYEHARDTPSGPQKLLDHWAVVGPKVDEKRLAEVTKEADKIDDLIANRGIVLEEDIVVERGAYLPGVTVDDLADMELYPDDHVWEEKGFTSTFLGDAEGRARSYPALGKWESIHRRHEGKLVEFQDEVGTAVRFYITLPKGTKVASVEAARRMEYEFPRIPNPDPMPDKVKNDPWWQAHPEEWTITDYQAQPIKAKLPIGQESGARRVESEILLGSGARFRVTKVRKGYTYQTGDPTLKPVEVYEVHMEYIGGGSSQGRTH